ncbi:hypothetical protein LT493_16495 [Streptomyces tricolor]|nr:hypothetical protein [Streptomyces tricolor]
MRLIAYVQSAAAPESLAAELAKRAEELLPGYLRPSRYITLTDLPLTDNGKVDRAGCPRRRARPDPPDRPAAPRHRGADRRDLAVRAGRAPRGRRRGLLLPGRHLP